MKKILLGLLCSFNLIVTAGSLNVAAFNIESMDAKAEIIIKQLQDYPEIDIWGLEEVSDEFSFQIDKAMQTTKPEMHSFLGSTGRQQKLKIIYNANKIKALDFFELHDMNINMKVRSPLVMLAEEKETNRPFLFIVNHLYRGSKEGRHKQATMLNQWAKEQIIPIIAVGDYNFDLNPENTDQHDLGFDHMIADDIFMWAKPEKLAPTQCSNYHSILDFVFVALDAKKWLEGSKFLFDDNFCDYEDNTTSDHRPVSADFNIF